MADVEEGTGSAPVSDAVVVTLPGTASNNTDEAEPERETETPEPQTAVASLDAHRHKQAPRSISSKLPAPKRVVLPTLPATEPRYGTSRVVDMLTCEIAVFVQAERSGVHRIRVHVCTGGP